MRNIFIFITAATLIGQTPNNYEDLQLLFQDWRGFESPPLLNGAPDYTKQQFKKRQRPFKVLKKRLTNIDTTGWPVAMKVDLSLIHI